MLAFPKISSPLVVIFSVLVLFLALFAIGNFFNLSLEIFVPYIVWFLALGLFMVLLPKKVGLVFEDN